MENFFKAQFEAPFSKNSNNIVYNRSVDKKLKERYIGNKFANLDLNDTSSEFENNYLEEKVIDTRKSSLLTVANKNDNKQTVNDELSKKNCEHVEIKEQKLAQSQMSLCKANKTSALNRNLANYKNTSKKLFLPIDRNLSWKKN
jgi:hypothetical protein